MVRLSTVYDSELKEQVFKLRGDEDYARTTKTLLELGNVTLDSFNFDLDISVDVLRDRGDSKILVYDNDILMPLYENNVLVGESIDWSSQDTAKTLQLKGLDYDVQHNIVAKYMGNNKCSPSNSITQTITREDTYRAEATLTLTNATQQFNPNASLSDTITLSNDHDASYNIEQTLTVYYDGTQIGNTLTTDENGQATISISDVGTAGIHTLQIFYEGSRNLTSKTLTLPISVGYKLEIINPPSIMVYGDGASFSARYTDWFDQPISGATVDLEEVTSQTVVGQGGTIPSGVVVITVQNIGSGSFPESVPLRFKVGETTSESFTTVIVDTQTITITSSTPRLYKNQQTVISIDTHNQYEGIPVQFNMGVDIHETIYTNSQGIATKTVMGTGVSDKLITASVGNGYEELTLEDYELYWSKDNENVKIGDFINRGYPYTIYELNNLFSIYTTNDDTAVLRVSSGGSWEMIMEGISTPTSTRLSFSSYYTNAESSYHIPLDLYDIRTYLNAKIVLKSENGVISATVYEGETVIGTRSDITYNIASMVFRNFASNALQANFKKVSFRRL